jgi:hypothetical protein
VSNYFSIFVNVAEFRWDAVAIAGVQLGPLRGDSEVKELEVPVLD